MIFILHYYFRYLLRQQNVVASTANSNPSASESKYSGYINNVKIRTAAKTKGGSKLQQSENDSSLDDGEVADLQCLLANALLLDDSDSKNISGYRI